MPTVYYGEAAGPRVIALTTDVQQVTAEGTEDVLLSVLFHSLWPAGSAGDVILRELTPVVRTNNGAVYDVTPLIDDVPQTTQRVTVVGAVTQPTPVYPTNDDVVRGSRIGVRIDQVSPRVGDFELIDVGYTIVVLRRSP